LAPNSMISPTDMESSPLRMPIGYASTPERHRQKWDSILSVFLAGDWDRLSKLQRTGTRGRIFSTLVKRTFEAVGIDIKPEPVFESIAPAAWYREFAGRHGLKLRIDEQYNPDFLLADGTWAEATLSENTAYKKLFRYGHQAPRLQVIWLDIDDGLHQRLCEEVEFPNASVRPVDEYFPMLMEMNNGAEIVRQFESLRTLKGQVL
jgi:hypothetical protein